MRVYKSVSGLIGHTPLMEACNIEKEYALESKILLKLESFNPAGSSKDRVALQMISDAEKDGTLKPGGTVIEPTSGNTGIGICAICASKGYKAVIVMPDSMSEERRMLVKAYGADLVLTDGSLGMTGACRRAEEIKNSTPNSIIAGQFTNPSNPEAHYLTTGPEIWEDSEGNVDVFVAGIGTGGTVSGTGRYLKEKNPGVTVVGIEPASSPLLSQGKSGKHGLQGIGADFIPENYDKSVVDRIMTVSDREAYMFGKELASLEGLLCGITSGAALCAAVKLGKLPEFRGKTIVALLPDTGERYLSTPLFK